MTARPLRSVLLTPNLLGADGVSSLSREIAAALPKPSAVLSLHDAAGGSSDLPDGVEAYGADGSRGAFLAKAAQVSVHCSSSTQIVCSHLHLAPAATALAWRGGRVTVVLCGIEAWVPLRKAEAWALDRAALVAISRHTAARFKQANPGFASTDVAVCHPGLPAAARQSNGSGAVGSPALIVARMSAAERYKGHDELLNLWPALLARRSDATLVVAGDGDDRSRLESRARSLGLSHAVTFVGRVSDARLAELYDACRFLVMPSRDEGFGLVFLEAMRAGKACIGGRGAAAEIIEHDVTGLIVDPGGAGSRSNDGEPGRNDELAAAVLRLFDEPDTCCRFGSAGRQRFLSTFTDVSFRTRFVQALERHAPAL